MVGETGFEPATPWSRTKCSTRLSHSPNGNGFNRRPLWSQRAQAVDGRDILANLKRDSLKRDLKVIMLSAIEDQYTRQVCLEPGAYDYALKPFDLTFMSKVARLVRETCGTLGLEVEPSPP